MPRKGLTRIEVPSGWTQLIRGPRPPAVQWPKAVHNQLATVAGPDVQAGVQQGVQHVHGRWRQDGQSRQSRQNPEVSVDVANKRVRSLEAAYAVLEKGGDTGPPEVKTLQTSLAQARRAAQEPPIEVQLSLCEQFVERAMKRLTQHDEQRAALAKEVAEGEARMERLRAQVSNLPVPPPVISAEEQIAMLEEDGRHHGRGATRSSPAGQCEEASYNVDQGGAQARRICYHSRTFENVSEHSRIFEKVFLNQTLGTFMNF